MIQRILQISLFATNTATLVIGTCVIAVLLAACAGCSPEASNGGTKIVHDLIRDMRDLAAAGDQESVEQLIESLDNENEAVRLVAQRGLESVLKRRIYFDPAAPEGDRNHALSEVRAMWQNLKERDLFEAVKKRMPIQYFYDMETGEVFEARAGRALIETESGLQDGMPTGVRAIVFACRDCAIDRYAAWLQVPVGELERYGVAYDVAGAIEEPRKSDLAVRRPDGGSWVLLGSPAAEEITHAARRCDERDPPLFCRPGR